MLPKAHFATVYAKPAGRQVVDTFITEVSQDTWILFPWDTEPQYAKPIADQEKTAAACVRRHQVSGSMTCGR